MFVYYSYQRGNFYDVWQICNFRLVYPVKTDTFFAYAVLEILGMIIAQKLKARDQTESITNC